VEARLLRDEGKDQETVAQHLGCLDLRTVRNHLRRLDIVSSLAARHLAESLAHIPQYVRLPDPDPHCNPLQRFFSLHQHAQVAALGAGWELISAVEYLQAEYWNARKKRSISHDSQQSRPP